MGDLEVQLQRTEVRLLPLSWMPKLGKGSSAESLLAIYLQVQGTCGHGKISILSLLPSILLSLTYLISLSYTAALSNKEIIV